LKYIETGLKFDPRTNQTTRPDAIEVDASKLTPQELELAKAGKLDPNTIPHAIIQKHEPNGSGLPSQKYFGEVATGYDAKRLQQPKWTVEQEIIERMLSDFPAGSWIVDAPCGTGRFFPYYESKRFVVRGVDISPDMLREAGSKIKKPVEEVDGEKMWGWRVANIIENGLGLEESSVDCALSIRFTRWVMGQYGSDGIQALLHELQRVSRSKVIFTARVKDHPNAVSYDLIKACIEPGWDIHEDVAGYEEAYRIICLGPAA